MLKVQKGLLFSVFFFWFSSFLLMSSSLFITNSSAAGNTAHYIVINDEISKGMAAYVEKAIENAKETEASSVIIAIDTYGGEVDAAISITNHIDSLGSIPVSAFVIDKAWSAGAMIALSCDNIYMQEGSSIGSAAPVSGGGGKTVELGEKFVSAIRAKFTALAEKNGHPSNLAAAMVDKDIEISKVSEKGKLLNLTSKQAKSLKFAANVFESKEQFFESLSIPTENILIVERGPFEIFVGFLTSAMVTSLLMSLGFLLLYLEFQAPGIGWAGMGGVICLGLVFFGQYLISYAEQMDLILFGLGVLLLLIEIFALPGFGFSGIGGMACILLALYLAFVPFGVPDVPWEMQMLKETLLMILQSLVFSFIVFLILLKNIHRIPMLNSLVLSTSLPHLKIPGETAKKRVLVIGEIGETTSILRPIGKGAFNGELYDLIAEQGMIKSGKKVELVQIRDHELVVRAVKKS